MVEGLSQSVGPLGVNVHTCPAPFHYCPNALIIKLNSTYILLYSTKQATIGSASKQTIFQGKRANSGPASTPGTEVPVGLRTTMASAQTNWEEYMMMEKESAVQVVADADAQMEELDDLGVAGERRGKVVIIKVRG